MAIISIVGGVIFIGLAFLSFFDRDRLWQLYSLEKTWRVRNPERTAEWDKNSRRSGYVYLAIGIITIALGLSAII